MLICSGCSLHRNSNSFEFEEEIKPQKLETRNLNKQSNYKWVSKVNKKLCKINNPALKLVNDSFYDDYDVYDECNACELPPSLIVWIPVQTSNILYAIMPLRLFLLFVEITHGKFLTIWLSFPLSDVDLFTRSHFDEDNASSVTTGWEWQKHATAASQLHCSAGNDMEDV